jgi:3-hydroxyisobutyrate dehydrogenase-like beta-hydroxyacid dehydrogenase
MRTVKLGFVGLGHMGRYMAANLVRAGYELTVNDMREAVRDDPLLAGTTWATSPRAVAEASDTVVTSLPGPEQVEDVTLGVNGLLSGLRAGGYYIDMTTSTPASMRRIAASAVERGIEVLDAPVAGGVRGARLGTLTIMVGASANAFAACEGVLRSMGERIFHVGDVGAGHVAKLVNNMMSIANGLIAMEAIVAGTKAGVDPQRLLEVAQAGTGGSYALNLFPYVIFKRNFDPAKFALSLAAKDLRISVEFAEQLGVPVSLVSHASDLLAGAMDRGLSDRDWSAYITLLEQQAGVEVRAWDQ